MVDLMPEHMISTEYLSDISFNEKLRWPAFALVGATVLTYELVQGYAHAKGVSAGGLEQVAIAAAGPALVGFGAGVLCLDSACQEGQRNASMGVFRTKDQMSPAGLAAVLGGSVGTVAAVASGAAYGVGYLVGTVEHLPNLF